MDKKYKDTIAEDIKNTIHVSTEIEPVDEAKGVYNAYICINEKKYLVAKNCRYNECLRAELNNLEGIDDLISSIIVDYEHEISLFRTFWVNNKHAKDPYIATLNDLRAVEQQREKERIGKTLIATEKGICLR